MMSAPLDEYKAFVLFCKEQGVVSAALGDWQVTFEPSFEVLPEEPEEEISDEEALFYSAGS